jgi:hypothetical protein
MRLSFWMLIIVIAIFAESKYGWQIGLNTLFVGFVGCWLLELLLGDSNVTTR